LLDSQKKVFASFFNLSREKLSENYNIKYLGRENVGGSIPAWHLELTPKVPGNLKTIEIWIDGSGMPLQTKITENNGDWINILLSNLQKNAAVNASDFKITLPKETKIIRN
ncbi:MAG: LolA family protein, partial [Pyrinomonadaceae bacterium]